MILHLHEKMAIKMTTSQKFEYKAEGYGKQWDPMTLVDELDGVGWIFNASSHSIG
jgi:hypothetical protein